MPTPIPESILFLIVAVSFVIVVLTLIYTIRLRILNKQVLKKLHTIEEHTDSINRTLETTLEVVRDQQSN